LRGAHAPFEALFEFYSKLIYRWIEQSTSTIANKRNLRQSIQSSLEATQNHVSTLILSALAISDATAASVVSYLDSVSIATTAGLKRAAGTGIPIVVPQKQAYYMLLLSSSLATVSRLCTILNRYYISISQSPRSYTPIVNSSINTYLMDTCNLIYRARAFVSTDQHAAGCLCPKETFDELQFYLPKVDREYALATMFGFSWHPQISSVAREAFRELELAALGQSDNVQVWHNGPVGQRSLVLLANESGANISWKEYRIKVLQWLGERGLGGIEEFLFATIKDLSR
jgi:centromere protein I